MSSSIAELNSGTGTSSGFLFLPLERNLNADTDVRSLAFLSRLTEALHASPFCSYLKCETLTGIGTSDTFPIQIRFGLHNVKSDFRGDISALREQAVNQWKEFVVTAVLADYRKSSSHARGHTDCETLELIL